MVICSRVVAASPSAGSIWSIRGSFGLRQRIHSNRTLPTLRAPVERASLQPMTFPSLHRGLLAAAAFAAALPAQTTAAAALKPNFVFVYADDMRWDAMGVVQREQGDRARVPWLKTPNIDRL